MGGYNTFCEILSFNKRALVVPRTEPRKEQYIRATQAEQLGLLKVLIDTGERDGKVMATALRNLSQQPLPADSVVPGPAGRTGQYDQAGPAMATQARGPGCALPKPARPLTASSEPEEPKRARRRPACGMLGR